MQHGLAQRIGWPVRRGGAGKAVSGHAAEPHPRQNEQRAIGAGCIRQDGTGAVLHRAARLVIQPGSAVHQDHGKADQAAEQRERIQQRPERDIGLHPQIGVEAERHAFKQIAEGHPEHQGRNDAANAQRPVPPAAPAGIFQLAAELEADRAHDQRRQHQKHGEIETGKARGIECRPGGENRAATQDEPDLVSLPDRPNTVDGDAALHIAAANKSQKRSGAQIETVGDGKAAEQHAQQKPPYNAQHLIAHAVTSLPK